MPEIFINYRTGDTEETAAAVDADLTHRFGADRVFFAGRSIAPASRFDASILEAVRASKVLIALIGPNWLAPGPQGRPRVFEAEDWVRREIGVALRSGVHVLPVLVGRKTERITPKELPPDIKGLGLVQTRRYDHRDAGAFRASFAEVLTDLIPSLVDRSTAEPAAAAPPGGNSVSDTTVSHGSIFQAGGDIEQHTTTNNGLFSGTGTISGELSGTFINDSHGPVNSGRGPMYITPEHPPTGQSAVPGEDTDRA